MLEDCRAMIVGLNGAGKAPRQVSTDVVGHSSMMPTAGYGGDALDATTEAQTGPKVGAAARCAPCTAFPEDGAMKAGAVRDAVAKSLGLAVYRGAEPSVVYAVEPLEAVDQLRS